MAFGLTPLLIQVSADVAGAVSGLQNVKSHLGGLKDVAKTAAGMLLGQLAHDALGAVTGAASEASKSFMEYEQTLTKIISATNAVGAEAEELRNVLMEVSGAQTDLGFSASESAAALEALVKAGMTAEESSQALRSALSLARLEGINTEQAASLLVQTLTMFNLTADKSADALDAISKAADAGIDTAAGYASGLANAGAAAANMGLSLEETLAALVQLDKTYGSATESGTYLNAMFKDLIAKSDQLDISLYNADGSMRSLDDIVGQIRVKVQAFGNDQAAANQYLSVFDVRAQRAVLGLINYDGSLGDTMATMEGARDVQEKVNMVMDTAAGKTAKLNAEQENATYQLGEMTSQLQLTWKQFALGLGPIGAVIDALGPTMLQGAIAGVTTALPQLIAHLITTNVTATGAAGGISLLGTSTLAVLAPVVAATIAGLALVGALKLIGDWARAAYYSIDHTAEEIAKASNMMDDYTESIIDANKALAAQKMLEAGYSEEEINRILGKTSGGTSYLPAAGEATSTPNVREVNITQYNTINNDMDMKKAAEDAYRIFVQKLEAAQ